MVHPQVVEESYPRAVILKAEKFDSSNPEHIEHYRLLVLEKIEEQKNAPKTPDRVRRLQALRNVLKRIKNGAFGKCYVCQTDLARKQLDSDVTVTRCRRDTST